MSPVRVHHETAGPDDAPAVVLSASLGSDLRMWEPQVAPLAQHFRVVRYDHRGHGQSPVPDGPYRIEELADDLLGVLDQLGIERAHLCGVSLGGMVGMQLAAMAPDRVDRLVLCCTSAKLGTPASWHDRAAVVRARGVRAVADAVWGRWFTPAFDDRHPGEARELRSMLEATPTEGYAACCEAIALMDLVPLLARIRAPTLVLAGADDPATPPEHGRAIVEAVPDARLMILPHARHLANVEQDDAVTSVILQHLRADPP